jgi:hypothetical protein
MFLIDLGRSIRALVLPRFSPYAAAAWNSDH